MIKTGLQIRSYVENSQRTAWNGTIWWQAPATSDIEAIGVAPDGTIIAAGYPADVYAFSPTGAQKWTWTSPGGSSTYTSPFAIGVDGTAYIGSNDHNLYAISPSGVLLWKFTAGNIVDDSPVVDANGGVYFTSNDHKLYALDANGALRWSYTFAGTQQYLAGPVISASGHLYVLLASGDFYEF